MRLSLTRLEIHGGISGDEENAVLRTLALKTMIVHPTSCHHDLLASNENFVNAIEQSVEI